MTTPAELLQREIRATGAISFARFMELALYCPVCGYYEKEKDRVGKRGDFFTSVSIGPHFGQLLAFQFAAWLETAAANWNSRLSLVEAGAHDGRLAADVLGWMQRQRPELFERLEYVIIEPSARRQRWQRETLGQFGPHVLWLKDLPAATGQHNAFNGVIFCNEFLDALPVCRFGWDAARRQWFEWGVGLNDHGFAWVRLQESPPVSDFTLHAPEELLLRLPDEFTIEVCAAANQWWERAANSLAAGRLMTIDYGHTMEECFSPERRNGTLRAFHRHRLTSDVLAHPGEQDLTAHVNFASLMRAGRQAGLTEGEVVSQEKFLVSIAKRIWAAPDAFGDWTEACTRQFKTLVHPQHLGRSFRVVIQAR